MNTEKELIGKIRQLRQIKPRKEWVFLTKNQILGVNQPLWLFKLVNFFGLSYSFGLRRMFVPVLAIFVLIFGLFGFAQNSLPGDLLYPIKKLTEKSQAVFVSEEDKTKIQLELTNKRLEELTKIANENKINKLAPAIDEAQKSLTEATKNLKKEQKVTREILDQTKKIVENKEKVEKVLGTQITESENFENALKELVEREIKNLEKMDLSLFSEEKVQLLEKAKSDFEAGNYSEALIKIWNLTQK